MTNHDEHIRLTKFGDNKVFVISSLVMYEPNVELLFEVAKDLQYIAQELIEYARDNI